MQNRILPSVSHRIVAAALLIGRGGAVQVLSGNGQPK
jgi:hypothetical protein